MIRAADRDFAKTGNRPDLGVVKSSGNTFPANAVIPSTGQYVPLAAGFQCEKRKFSVGHCKSRPSLRPCTTWPEIA